VSDTVDMPEGDPGLAFDAMRQELAMLRYAVQGFAGKQEELAARDYTPDLARLIDLQDQMVGAINALARRPGVALTPETMAAQIEAAVVTARRGDRETLADATRGQVAAAQQLDAMIGRVRDRQKQRDALIYAWVAGMMTLMALIIIVELIAGRLG
jgi:hypothetical protein